jgi:hypothetical protein
MHDHAEETRSPVHWTAAFLLFFALILAIAVATAMRFLNEDLYVGFCAGRDILAGRMGLPDAWSFTTGGAVWVNQGWLSHLCLYVSYLGFGEIGPVLLKIVLLIICAAVLAVRAERLGASRNAALAALCLGTSAVAPFLQIRAENFGVTLFALMGLTLSGPEPPTRMRCTAAALIMLVWVNAHGSFILGFALIGLRMGVDAFVTIMGRVHESVRDVVRNVSRAVAPLLGLLAFSVIAAALLNPFGPINLLMPHRQLSATVITDLSGDWAPLWTPQELTDAVWFNPMDVRPFTVVSATLIVLCAIIAFRLLRGAPRMLRPSLRIDAEHPGLLLEIILPILLVPLTFKFRRLILFAGLTLVPVTAFLIQRALYDHHSIKVESRRAILTAAALILIAASVLRFTTLPPFLPGNPCRPDRPLVSRLMSFDAPSGEFVRFMEENHIGGRCFTGWALSDYFLFHIPGITVFMDCRDQSVYSDEVIRDFFEALYAGSRRPDAADAILRRRGANRVILSGNPTEYDLARGLQETRRWGCVYTDGALTLLAPVDDERFGEDLRAGRVPELRFPNERVEDLTRAYCSYFMTGVLSEPERAALKRAAAVRPDPNIYGLLTLTGLEPSGRIGEETRAYLTGEVKRLALVGPYAPGVGLTALESLIRIFQLLGAEAQTRPEAGAPPEYYSRVIDDLQRTKRQLQRNYLGYRFR